MDEITLKQIKERLETVSKLLVQGRDQVHALEETEYELYNLIDKLENPEESDDLIETSFKTDLRELLDRYNFDMYIDFDRLGACGPIEACLCVENRGYDIEHISFDLDELVKRPLCP